MPTYIKLPTRTAYQTFTLPSSKGTARPASSNNVGKSEYVRRDAYVIGQAAWSYTPGKTGFVKGK